MYQSSQIKRKTIARGLWVVAVALCFAMALSASDAVVRGVVTDNNGKPIRGAIVRVTAGIKSVIRYSQADGHYAIPVPPGTYTVKVDAFSFQTKKQTIDTAKGGDVNFQMMPGINVSQLTSAEVMSVLPNTSNANLIKSTCFDCHGSTTVLLLRGSPTDIWQSFLPNMTKARFHVGVNPKQIPAYSQALGEYFGPQAQYFGPNATPPQASQIAYTKLSDEALKATIREYDAPRKITFPMVHSVTVDRDRGVVWFSEYDDTSNQIVRFHPKTEKFDVFPIPVAKVNPHTGAILKDGSFIVALAGYDMPAKLAEVDANGKLHIYDWAEKKDLSGHTCRVDPTGRYVWMTAGTEVWRFDNTTKQFKAYTWPVPSSAPEGSQAAVESRGSFEGGGSYDLDVDGNGVVWISLFPLGSIVRLDPETGATQLFHTAGVRSTRGLAVDAQNNIWFGDFYGHELGMLNTETGKMTEYQPPTSNASPYGLYFDRRTGYVWYADTDGNNITRFDPKTSHFVEYKIPTINSSVRFMSVDAHGRAWYGGFFGGQLGVIDPNGGGQELASAQK